MNAATTIATYRRAAAEAEAAELADPDYRGDGGRCRTTFDACPWWYRWAWTAHAHVHNFIAWGVLPGEVPQWVAELHARRDGSPHG